MIAVWLAAVAVIVPLAPRLSEVASTDQGSFLPSSYESAKADAVAKRHFAAGSGASSVFVVRRPDGAPLGGADRSQVARLARDLQRARIPRVTEVSTGPAQVAPSRRAQLVSVFFRGTAQDQPVRDAVKALRAHARASLAGSGLSALLTGEAAIQVDSRDSSQSATRTVGVVTVALIVVLLGAIFRGPLAALMPIVAIGGIYALATALLASLAKVAGFKVDQGLTTLLVVVLFGIGTDYVLFLLFRYRERLRAGDEPAAAVAFAVARVGQAIASSALVVIVAFVALGLSTLGSLRDLAPGFLIAVVLMLLAALTLIPALLTLLGARTFWPSRNWQRTPQGTLARRIGALVGRHPARTALVLGPLLVALGAAALFYRADYDIANQLPASTEAAKGFTALKAAFPAGALNPTQVYVVGAGARHPGELRGLAARLRALPGVATVGRPQTSRDGRAALVSVELRASPYANTSLDLVAGPLRRAAHAGAPPGTVLVGGQSSTLADVRAAVNRDYKVVFPAAAVLIGLILGVVLRSVVAPLYLLLAVALGFAATLGASVVAFQGIAGDSGLTFFLPTIVYLFVVAMGTDYNILITTRLREEVREGNEPRRASALAVEHAAPTVAAAGVILAGTFASLALGGVGLLTQLGFTVAIGIVIVSFLMAAVLIPSVTALLGPLVWWPGHSAERAAAPESPRPALPARPLRDEQ